MRTTFAFSAIVLAFIAGVAVTWIAPTADAQTPAPAAAAAAARPQVINIADMKDEEIGPFIDSTDLRDLRSGTLVTTQYGTIAVQSGNVPKHFHADANEI